MPDRLVVVGLVAMLVLAAVVLGRVLARRQAARLHTLPSSRLWKALGLAPDGRPTVVAFTSPSCAVCHSAQLPALNALVGQAGKIGVRVLGIDIAAQPHVARDFGVLTVPTTVVFRSDGRIAAVNHGFAPVHRLATQISAAR